MEESLKVSTHKISEEDQGLKGCSARLQARGQFKRGFTLLEVLIAMAVLLIGFSGIFALLSYGQINHRDAIDTSNAGLLSANLFDDIVLNYHTLYADRNKNTIVDAFEDQDRNGILDGAEQTSRGDTLFERMPSLPGYRYNINIHHSAYTTREIFVRIEVSWDQQGQGYSESFYRIIFLKRDA